MKQPQSPDHGVSDILNNSRMTVAVYEYPQYRRFIERVYINAYKYILYMRRFKMAPNEIFTEHDDFWNFPPSSEIPKQSRVDKALEDIVMMSKENLDE